MMRRTAILATSVVLTAGVSTACGEGDNSSAPPDTGTQTPVTAMPTTAQPAGPEIVISNSAYTVPVSVKPGEKVAIVNKDQPNHTVTADEINLFDVRISGGGGISTLTARTAPGTYPFHCKYHANMRGSLIVQ